MQDELDDRLVNDFPNLYRDRHAPAHLTCMCWGFDVGDGWFNIIYDLSAKLENLILKLPEEERAGCCASQVKQKFGGLRFYMSSQTPEMSELIDVAEELASKTCEICGEIGKLRNGSWIETLCDKHAEEKAKKK